MVTYFQHRNGFRKKRCFHKTFRQMLVHELVQLYLNNKANTNLVTSITRSWLPSIPPVRLSGKCFPSSNYPVRESYVVFSVIKLAQANIKRRKRQTSMKNVMYMSAKASSSDITPAVSRKEMKVAFPTLYFVFRVFLLIFCLL